MIVSTLVTCLLLSRAAAMSAMAHTPPARVVICGAGLHGSALAYYLTSKGHRDVVVVERHSVAAAASGKGGGFLARDWGAGPTVQLHETSFALHEKLAAELGVESYRRLPVLSVEPGARTAATRDLCPWLDGDVRQSSVLDQGGGAQVDPRELCTKLMDAALATGGARLEIGTVEGVETRALDGGESGGGAARAVTGVRVDGRVLEADAVAITMGPWAALAEDWLGITVPITGVKSTSIVFRSADPERAPVEPFALFCGEDDRFGTHLEVYPRASGEVYLCGIGGSEHVSPERLRAGEFPPGAVEPDPARVAAATGAFSAMSKRLGGAPDVTQACMRPCPPDAMPMMGKVGPVRGAYMSAGHNCWGILWAPVSGLSMAELIMDGAPKCVDLRPFAPGRFMQRAAGGRGRRRGAEPVGEQW